MYKITNFGFVIIAMFFLGQVAPVQAASIAPVVSEAVSIEKQVREYFVDVPVMIEIARCESKFRQFTDSGSVLRGGAGGEMIGVFQFYEKVHTSAASALSLDLATLEGNLSYARHLYKLSGTTPWLSAESCWKVAVPGSPVQVAELELQIALLTKIVGLLQQLLALQLAAK
jgi:hypothetical protein